MIIKSTIKSLGIQNLDSTFYLFIGNQIKGKIRKIILSSFTYFHLYSASFFWKPVVSYKLSCIISTYSLSHHLSHSEQNWTNRQLIIGFIVTLYRVSKEIIFNFLLRQLKLKQSLVFRLLKSILTTLYYMWE